MRGWLRPLLHPLLRRDEDEIDRRARGFRIEREEGRVLVSRLGSAFVRGYHAMLRERALERVAREGGEIPAHFRPFFFEGAAMGYLPRGYYTAGCSARNAERALVDMDPAFVYLYYVGLGFWLGFRHARHPERIEATAAHLDPLYAPLCWDGFGFKLGFFDFDGDTAACGVLERCPAKRRAFAYQGFGRSMFFVFMDDESGFGELKRRLPPERAFDLELGRALARGFTGVDRPGTLTAHVRAAVDARDRAARQVGITWALTARRRCDAAYFDACMERAGTRERRLLSSLPALCEAERARAVGYGDWQARTRAALERCWSD